MQNQKTKIRIIARHTWIDEQGRKLYARFAGKEVSHQGAAKWGYSSKHAGMVPTIETYNVFGPEGECIASDVKESEIPDVLACAGFEVVRFFD